MEAINPYREFLYGSDSQWHENPLYTAWEKGYRKGYNTHKQEVEEDVLREIREWNIRWTARSEGAGGG